MSAKLTTRQVGDVTVMDVSGRITLGEGSSALRDALHSAVEAGNRKILLNLGEVNYIDSSGIGELVAAYTAEDMTDDAVAVLDALGWDSAHLFGASMGGQLVQRIALRHPGRER